MPRQATGRATLAPVERRKGSTTYWQARGQVPVRNPDGSVGSRRVERGFGPDCTTERKRLEQCAAWNAEYEERFRNPKNIITFARAYTNYISIGHPVPLHAEKILKSIGLAHCNAIDDSVMAALVQEIFPSGAAPGTLNRHIYTPVIAVLRMTLKEKAPMLTRPKGHNEIKPVEVASMDWFYQLWPHLSPDQRASVAVLSAHGRRLGEILSRKPEHLRDGLLDLGKTKTGPLVIDLHPSALKLIHAMEAWQTREWLFSYGPNSQNSYRRDLKKACNRAGVKWISPHKFGRHTSVTRMLQAGWSVKHVADAHRMTPEMVSRRYGHLTKSETTSALHAVGGGLIDSVAGPIVPKADAADYVRFRRRLADVVAKGFMGEGAEGAFVYAIATPRSIKFGRAADILRRSRTLQIGAEDTLHELASVGPLMPEVAQEVEALVHGFLTSEQAHVRGEWFRKNHPATAYAVQLLRDLGEARGIARFAIDDLSALGAGKAADFNELCEVSANLKD